jgi:hypothetical protein
VLLFALGATLGELFTPSAQDVWIKVYSRMLRVLLPVATELEFFNSIDMELIPYLLPPPPPEKEEEKEKEESQTASGCPLDNQQRQEQEKTGSGKCPYSHFASGGGDGGDGGGPGAAETFPLRNRLSVTACEGEEGGDTSGEGEEEGVEEEEKQHDPVPFDVFRNGKFLFCRDYTSIISIFSRQPRPLSH